MAPIATVTFEPSGEQVCVEYGTALKEAAHTAGVALNVPCGGLGTCGRCAVRASGDLEPPTTDERTLLGAERLAQGVRLACRARVSGDVLVNLLEQPAASLRIIESGEAGEIVVEPPSARGITGATPLLGAVVDIGTTTVVATVLDLETGEQLGSASALNPQHPFGHDVMSRITHVASYGTDSLREPIVVAVDGLVVQVLARLAKPVSALREMAIAGNTTMIHLFLGIDPKPLGTAPYEPAFLDPLERPAHEVGLTSLTEAGVYFLPGISAFVGADITAGLLATHIAERERIALLIDLGTNGEMVLRTHKGLVASSTAAGPALEGASISYGMRAENGAIERVFIEGDELRIEVIGGGEARGLCGSGLLDLVAVLLDAGVLDHTGLLRDDAPHSLAARITDLDDVRAFEVAPGVFLTQRDVRQVQLANAAIASGIDMMLDHAEVGVDEVEEIVIAGGFGYHVKAEALVRMGMIPARWQDRVTFGGNTAKTGALVALLDTAARRRAEAIARHVATIDLAAHPDFQTRFVGAMNFPEEEAQVAHLKFDMSKIAKLDDVGRFDSMKPDVMWEALGSPSPATIVEIGAGTGLFAERFSELAPQAKVYAVDTEAGMLDWIREHRQGIAGCIVPVLSEERSVPLEDGIAELVTMLNLHHELEEPAAIYAEAYRLLAPRGQILVVDWAPVETPKGPPLAVRASAEQIAAFLEGAGFSEVVVHDDALPWHSLVTAKRP